MKNLEYLYTYIWNLDVDMDIDMYSLVKLTHIGLDIYT